MEFFPNLVQHMTISEKSESRLCLPEIKNHCWGVILMKINRRKDAMQKNEKKICYVVRGCKRFATKIN